MSYGFIFFIICSFLSFPDTRVLGASSNILEQRLLQLFTIWRTGNIEQLPFKLPALNKIVIKPFEGQYSGKGVKMSFSTSQMELTGLDSFSIENLNASDETLDASISVRIENATLFAENYKLSGRAYYVYPLKGSGNMRVFFKNIFLFASLQLDTNGTSLWITDMKFDYQVEKVVGELIGSTWPINKILRSDSTRILASYHDDIVRAVVKAALPYANEFLVDFSPQELLNMIH